MDLLNLLHKYRLFRANNRYNYPFLFLMLGVIKNICQLSVLAAAGWFVVSFASQPQLPDSEYVTRADSGKVSVETNAPTQKIEILAVASASGSNAFAGAPAESDEQAAGNAASNIHNWEWLLRQDKEKFTVQFGSSPDKALLLESAQAFPTSEIVSVFPFKKTPGEQPVYGFSSGIYDSLDSAEVAISNLPKSVRSFGVWIRPIGEVQKQITSMVKS